MSLSRILAITLRNLFDMRHNWARIMDIFFWPMIDILLWGFMTVFLIKTNTNLSALAATILGAMIMWSLYFRIQQDVGFSFITDVWERNVLNVFASPITFKEFFIGTMILGLTKLMITAVAMTLVCWLFYNYNFLAIGPILFLFLGNLIFTGWIIGIIAVSLVLRFGTKAEYMIWWLPFLLQPFSAVTYPVSLLPLWMQIISRGVPATYVFEGLRSLVLNNTVSYYDLVMVIVLNLIYFIGAVLIFKFVFNTVKEKGLLAKLV